jgi:uncharacterized protein
MQSNALLFTEEIGDLMLKHRVGIGVSIDGPPEWNDVFRLDHLGRPTGHLLAEPLKLLLSEKYRKIFSGVLCVINIDVDPVAIFDYFESLGIRNMDFLLPLDNHDRPPKGKEVPEASPYGDWLIRLFDRWWDAGATADIRTFSAILKGIANLPSGVESIGLSPADLVVVETNGAIEGVDSLKAAADGATDIGLDIFSHSFEEAAKHHAVQIRQSGTTQLCSTCKQCPVVRVCGGGYYPHRYSKINGFENPSVYCLDLQKIIRHIHTRLVKDLASLTPQEKSA